MNKSTVHKSERSVSQKVKIVKFEAKILIRYHFIFIVVSRYTQCTRVKNLLLTRLLLLSRLFYSSKLYKKNLSTFNYFYSTLRNPTLWLIISHCILFPLWVHCLAGNGRRLRVLYARCFETSWKKKKKKEERNEAGEERREKRIEVGLFLAGAERGERTGRGQDRRRRRQNA